MKIKNFDDDMMSKYGLIVISIKQINISSLLTVRKNETSSCSEPPSASAMVVDSLVSFFPYIPTPGGVTLSLDAKYSSSKLKTLKIQTEKAGRSACYFIGSVHCAHCGFSLVF